MNRLYLPEADGDARLQQPEFHQSVLADEQQPFSEVHLCHEGSRRRSERNRGLFRVESCRKKTRFKRPAPSYGSRPGHLRGIFRTAWSRRLQICCRSGRRPPPLQHTVTQVPQKRAQLSPCTVLRPEVSDTVSSQVTCRFLRGEKTKAPGTDQKLQAHF